MRKALALVAVALAVGVSATAFDAEAKRLGGGRSSGMQRQAVTAPAAAPDTARTPGRVAPSAAPATAGAAAAAAAPKRSWMGPVAGLAAGLGLAALASHFGFGEALANLLTIGLLAMAVLFVVGLVMRKRASTPSMAGAGAGRQGMFGASSEAPRAPDAVTRIGSRIGADAASAVVPTPAAIPADFDEAGFVRNAKTQFLALQAANDARDLDRLRDYLTPEMFEVVREEILARDTQPQRTEVFGLEAQVLEVVQEPSRYLVSVRFTGSVREQPGATPEDLDEVWHLAKPRWGQGGWVIAGIQQVAVQ